MSTWLLAAGLVACSGTPPAPTPTVATPQAPPAAAAPAPVADDHAGPGAHASKPSAPIDLALTARSLGATATGERFEVVLTATPRRALERVELAIDGQPAVVAGATAAGIASERRATVEVARGEGKDVIATAVVMVDGQRMGAATQVRIGAPADATPPGKLITLPDGTQVREVRP